MFRVQKSRSLLDSKMPAKGGLCGWYIPNQIIVSFKVVPKIIY